MPMVDPYSMTEIKSQATPIRFSDVKLGEPIALDQGAGATTDMASDRICDAVRLWSGSPSASLVSIQTPGAGLVPDRLDGRILARHLDGSNQADVEIFLRAQETICLRAVVRVALG